MTNRFSIAMCTYNGARYLKEQLASFASQTRLPDELVVCDDGSEDATRELLGDFAGCAPFPVRIFANERNLGSTLNFERAIGLCDGDLIALSDQDDVWISGKLARLESEFDQHPEVGLVFSDADLVDEHTNRSGETLWARLGFSSKEAERLRAGEGFDELLKGATVTGATLAFRARFKDLLLPIPNDLPLIHDGWIAALLACVAGVLPINESLVLYRKHEGQQVGALQRRTPAGGWDAIATGQASEAMRRSNPYSEALSVARRVRERLLDRTSSPETVPLLQTLDGRIAHLEIRSNLPRGLRRAGPVLRELLTFRYSRYSKGLMSAFKDLFSQGSSPL